jgi:flagellar protein FlbT
MYEFAYNDVIEDSHQTLRAREQAAMDRVIEMLRAAQEKGAQSRELIDALFYLRRLWMIFIDDLNDPNNELPAQLRAGERFFINGAVIRIDRKASIELLNEVTFLLENHVMQVEEATTLVRQIYFAVQIMLMDPTAAASATPLARSLIESALTAYRAPELTAGLRSVDASLLRGRNFEALKALRGLFAFEDKELQPLADTPSAA